MKATKLLPWLTAALVAVPLTVAAAGNAKSERSGATIKEAIVTDTAGLNDKSFNHLANLGRLRAQKELKIKTQVFISVTASDYLRNLAAAAQQGNKGIVANGFLLAADTDTAAQKFPDVKFAIVDFPGSALEHKPANAVGITFKAQESGYLVGYLAGLMVKKQGGPQVMSSVGGKDIPSVASWIAGYQAGAKQANPKVQLLNAFSGDFPPSFAPKCKELALNQISQGSQVVFQVAGGCGLGALDAAKEKGKWGIGVDADQAYLGKHILTSGVKRVDVGVYNFMRQVKLGKFKAGRDLAFNLKNKGMDVGKISPKVPKAFIAKMNAIKKLIIAGKIKPPEKLSTS